jgi:hypothetical protein
LRSGFLAVVVGGNTNATVECVANNRTNNRLVDRIDAKLFREEDSKFRISYAYGVGLPYFLLGFAPRLYSMILVFGWQCGNGKGNNVLMLGDGWLGF